MIPLSLACSCRRASNAVFVGAPANAFTSTPVIHVPSPRSNSSTLNKELSCPGGFKNCVSPKLPWKFHTLITPPTNSLSSNAIFSPTAKFIVLLMRAASMIWFRIIFLSYFVFSSNSHSPLPYSSSYRGLSINGEIGRSPCG